MFRCQLCHQSSPSSTPLQRVITAVRPAEYPFREGTHKRRVGRKRRLQNDRGGKGHEIAEERRACAACSQRSTDLVPRQEPARPPRRSRQAIIEDQLYSGRLSDEALGASWGAVLPKRKRAASV